METIIEDQINRIIERKSRATQLDNLIQGYRLYARTEGKSPKTIRITTTAVTTFKDFLDAKRFSTDVTEIGAQELREFILHLQQVKAFEHHRFTRPQNKGLAGHTINCYLRAIRAFWSWRLFEEMIDANPFDKIRIPKPPKRVIIPFSEEQIKSLLAAIDTHSPTGFRDYTIILMLLDTGLRVSELCHLKLEDSNVEKWILKVCGKGDKERVVPIGGTVQRAIAKYLNRYRPKPTNQLQDYFFLTRTGEPLTGNRVETIIEKYGIKIKIKGVRCSPHTFRHTFAVGYLRNGGDVFSLQRILGHSTLDMVRNYIALTQSDLQAAHLHCSPVDNLRLKAGRLHTQRQKGVLT